MYFTDAWMGNALLSHASSRYSYTSSKSSAISISRDWVLTHGTALDTIINTSAAVMKFVANMVPGQLTGVPEELAKQLEFTVLRELKTGVKEHLGKVVFAWICPLLVDTFDKYFNDWSFYERNTAKWPQLLRTLFLLVRVDAEQSFAKVSADRALRSLQASSRSCVRGEPVEIVSVPFGQISLMNSVAQGVVSNVIGGIVLTDAYVFPKSEGGPVYVVSPDRRSRSLVGMVIVTMTWCRNEWVHYTFAANLARCLAEIWPKHRPSIEPAVHYDNPIALDTGVVMITCGVSKGTGVFVDKDNGTFLTCSHVIEEAPNKEISVVIFKNGTYVYVSAKLLFRNLTKLPYDVAILKVDPNELDLSLKPIEFSDTSITPGEPVFAVGFALYLPTRPTVSSGIVSKSLDCMLVTTCCIHGGFSGGPIISQTTGKMLGMIASNIQSLDNSVHFQRMSLSVPVTVLSKPLRQYLLTDNVDALLPLMSDDPIVQRTWAMEPHPRSKL